MADEATKKRSFRKYTYRGVDLDQLLDMKTDELVELYGARQRRRCVPLLVFVVMSVQSITHKSALETPLTISRCCNLYFSI